MKDAYRNSTASEADQCQGAEEKRASGRNVIRYIQKNGVRFVVTFDEDGVTDTIERNGVLINSAHRDARSILANADAIRSCTGLPKGCAFYKPESANV